MKRVIILGITGSIGRSALDCIRRNPERYSLAGISAHRNSGELIKITNEFPDCYAVLSGFEKDQNPAPGRLYCGDSALHEMISATSADIVVNGISGAAGLRPSISALESGKDIALANKETIVMAGKLIRELASANKARILPVDSEHSAVFSLIEAHGIEIIDQVILTASGGPFRTWSTDQLAKATAADALRHPTWSMGSKITIDSASLANKGLEVIEACRLFDLTADQVKVVVHPESLIHSMIRTRDGILYAQISPPDMRHPILHALSWPEVYSNHLQHLNLETSCSFTFEPPRWNDFPLLKLAYDAAGRSGSATIAYNAANEIAVEAFLAGKISFTSISAVVNNVLENDWSMEPSDFETVYHYDNEARRLAREAIDKVNS